MTFSRALLALSLVPVLFVACAKKDPPKQPPVPVTVGAAERRAVPYELAATGTVEPIQTVAIQAQMSGPIVRVAFREGQDVKKGQVLFELDPRPFQAALKQAEGLLARDHATASNAAEQAKRYSALAEKEYVTAEQYDATRSDAAAATATVAASQAAVDQARLNLQYATIRAPISGRTGSLRVREGNLVRVDRLEPAGHHQPDPTDPRALRRAGGQPGRDPALPRQTRSRSSRPRPAATPPARARSRSWTTPWIRPPGPSCSRAVSPTRTGCSGRASSSTSGFGCTSTRTPWWCPPRPWSRGSRAASCSSFSPTAPRPPGRSRWTGRRATSPS